MEAAKPEQKRPQYHTKGVVLCSEGSRGTVELLAGEEHDNISI